MLDDGPPKSTASQSMPQYVGVLTADMEGFTSLPGASQPSVSTAIETVIDTALSRSLLDTVRDGKLFPRNTGDGVVFGFPVPQLPQIIGPFMEELDAAAAEFGALPDGRPLRLRVAVTVGPLPVEGRPGDGNGTARNDAHRLVDSEQVKRALADAAPAGPRVVAIVSDAVHRDVVLDGWSKLDPARFTKVLATVAGKTYAEPAWIYLPSAGRSDDPAAESPEAPAGQGCACQHFQQPLEPPTGGWAALALALDQFNACLGNLRTALVGPPEPSSAD